MDSHKNTTATTTEDILPEDALITELARDLHFRLREALKEHATIANSLLSKIKRPIETLRRTDITLNLATLIDYAYQIININQTTALATKFKEILGSPKFNHIAMANLAVTVHANSLAARSNRKRHNKELVETTEQLTAAQAEATSAKKAKSEAQAEKDKLANEKSVAEKAAAKLESEKNKALDAKHAADIEKTKATTLLESANADKERLQKEKDVLNTTNADLNRTIANMTQQLNTSRYTDKSFMLFAPETSSSSSSTSTKDPKKLLVPYLHAIRRDTIAKLANFISQNGENENDCKLAEMLVKNLFEDTTSKTSDILLKHTQAVAAYNSASDKPLPTAEECKSESNTMKDKKAYLQIIYKIYNGRYAGLVPRNNDYASEFEALYTAETSKPKASSSSSRSVAPTRATTAY